MVGHTTLLLDVDASAIGWCGLCWGWRGGVQRRDQDPYGSFRLPEVPSVRCALVRTLPSSLASPGLRRPSDGGSAGGGWEQDRVTPPSAMGPVTLVWTHPDRLQTRTTIAPNPPCAAVMPWPCQFLRPPIFPFCCRSSRSNEAARTHWQKTTHQQRERTPGAGNR